MQWVSAYLSLNARANEYIMALAAAALQFPQAAPEVCSVTFGAVTPRRRCRTSPISVHRPRPVSGRTCAAKGLSILKCRCPDWRRQILAANVRAAQRVEYARLL